MISIALGAVAVIGGVIIGGTSANYLAPRLGDWAGWLMVTIWPILGVWCAAEVWSVFDDPA